MFKEARRNVQGAVEDNARRKKKREERNRGGTRDAFKLVSTSVHPPLPTPLSPRCFLHREAEKEEFVFFLRHTKSRVYVKERAADYLSSYSFFLFFSFFPFFFFSTAWRVTVANARHHFVHALHHFVEPSLTRYFS